jgi:hypothetical protein
MKKRFLVAIALGSFILAGCVPFVVSTSPTDGATDVPTTSSISINFLEDVDGSTVTTSTILVQNGSEPVYGHVMYSNKTAVFIPWMYLKTLTTYTVTVKKDIKNTSGESMSSDYVFSFTTGAAQVQYQLTVYTSTGGSVSPSGAMTVNYGKPTTITATPDSNYKFVKWTVIESMGVSIKDATSASTTVTLTQGNAKIQANFIRTYQLTVTAGSAGTASPSETITVTRGEPTNISAVATTEGYRFYNWTVASGSSSVTFGNAYLANTTVTLWGGDTTIQANFDRTSGVYVVGYDGFDAKIWKDDTVTSFSAGAPNVKFNSVFVSGNDVYVAGNYSGGAYLWTNGNIAPLTSGTQYSEAKSVVVYNNDVYVAGNNDKYAMVWKNGVATPLTDGSQMAQASSVFIYNNSVYVTGYENNGSKNVAKVWKDGALFQTLTDGSNSAFANSIFVKNDDVYVAGLEYVGTIPTAKIWKNGVAIQLTDGTRWSQANSVFVADDNTVYVSGYDGTVANVWKDGAIYKTLNDGSRTAYANAVLVSGTDMYVAGCEYNGSNFIAKLWKNDEDAIVLSDGQFSACAKSIFIAAD